jgi:hypothetical protein
MTSTDTVVLLALLAAAVLLLVVALAARKSRRVRQRRLRAQFGPEYERALEVHGNERKAERELERRERRVHKLHINELDAAHRVQFASDWGHAQTRFVDDPSGAVREADELINKVMRARGYPLEDFEHRAEDLSVDHANVVQHYRAARALAEANREGLANTEELRMALVHYRTLFSELLEEPRKREVVIRDEHEHAASSAR